MGDGGAVEEVEEGDATFWRELLLLLLLPGFPVEVVPGALSTELAITRAAAAGKEEGLLAGDSSLPSAEGVVEMGVGAAAEASEVSAELLVWIAEEEEEEEEAKELP